MRSVQCSLAADAAHCVWAAGMLAHDMLALSGPISDFAGNFKDVAVSQQH